MLLQLSAQFMDLFLYVVWLGASSVSTPTIISATQTPLAPTGSSWDPAIVAAVIGAVAALVAALIVVGVAIYQTRQSHKIEREKDEQQRRHEQEMERYRRELDLQYRGKEQEEQREETARREMLIAQNNVAKAVAYRKALHADPQISRLQILGFISRDGVTFQSRIC